MEISRKNIKKKKKYRKVLFFILSICLILLAVVGYKGYVTYTELNKITQGEEIKSIIRPEKVEVDVQEEPISILFLGLEDYVTKGVNGRTDAIILATYNPKDQTLKTLSVPRDTYVDIVNFNVTSKINGAYARGGIQTTVQTIENFLHVPIDYYVTVNFDGFKNIVDEVGGVTVDVPFDFWEHTDSVPREKVYFTKGMQHLNGQEALAYSRMRKRDINNDFGRQERQRQVLAAILNELKSPKSLLKTDTYAKEFSKNIRTNMGIGDAIKLYRSLPDDITAHIEPLSYTGKNELINGIWYYVADQSSVDDISSKFKNHLGITDNTVGKIIESAQ
ncbi:LCP family protein [Gottfriedia solisilvae]|uniref:Putative transcriptional regulator YvhJ n=1 Tax=Gottfriedia solisilvae TaxID=1516104 RepID=A0A8J3ACR7_9BACI|nr:LCP family protein [Gottfriedia solisilvae]GGI10952.1 putative transcriptional regulator YvhJ [Gottfriedia solisilvae]